MKSICLALQGGGAHGAFTWGVLDRLLAEEQRLRIEAISGTSAGAMNAVVLADGLMKGGSAGARERLRHFWLSISKAATASPLRRSLLDVLSGNWSLDHSPGYVWFDLISRVASPYDLNPFDINPVLSILDSEIDFARVRRCNRVKLFISATNVETGRIRVFEENELTAKAVMASACIPFLFQAVEIDGVPYWDGGYMGNPALFPFFHGVGSRDVVIVQINPVVRKGTPQTAREILNRVNEITFNSSLLREFRAIDFVSRLLDDGILDERGYKHMLVHRIDALDEMNGLNASSKLNAEWSFFQHLFDIGHRVTGNWLDTHYKSLGKESTLDLRAMFQGPESRPEATHNKN